MSDATPVTFVSDPALFATQGNAVPASTGTVVYRSTGHCLIIGELDVALEAIALMPSLKCTCIAVSANASDIDKRLLDTGSAVFTAAAVELAGHLGAFTATAHAATASTPTEQAKESSLDLGVAVWLEEGRFDVVLDLGDTPVFTQRLPPVGYTHSTRADLVDACESLDALVGEFDKPRYFEYRESVCAHSRSTLSGCTRCIDVCVTGAIMSAGEGVHVDPYLCQGCGSCATVCPSGAMSYAYPPVSEAVMRTREHYSNATESHTVILHVQSDQQAVDSAVDSAVGNATGSALSLAVEEVSAFGIDFWLTLLTGGVGRIVLVTDADDDNPNRLVLVEQSELLEQLLTGLGAGSAQAPVVHITSCEGLATCLENAPVNQVLASAQASAHAVHNDKRATIRAALDVLADRHPPQTASVALAAGAPFGRIRVDTDACTLCMACVSVCPAGSLLDGQDVPALRQIEANCVQCGLCESACPENAVTLEPRYQWDSVAARRTESLHEEEPFHCVRCHKAFATRRMIDTMTEKLAGHWMFDDAKALRRLKMCEDCRVKDMFENDAAGIDVRKTTPPA